MEYDLLFFLQDTFILDFLPELIPFLKAKNIDFKSICYFPIDGAPKEQWVKNVGEVDYLVAYSEFGKAEALNAWPEANEVVKNMQIMPHGVNLNDYHVLPEEDIRQFRERYFAVNKDKFIFTNLNRNQQRKDIPRTIQAFAEFRKQVPDSLLYLHMAQKDQGWDLVEVCKAYGFDTQNDVVFPQNFGPNQGYPREIVNMLYNISDCVLSTTLGEGFGFCMWPNTCIYTENGVKEIKDITVVDKVLSSDGTYNEVQAIMSREHDDDLYEITTWMSNIPIKSSSEHGFKVFENEKYIWKKASDLRVDDILLFPKKRNFKSNKLCILDMIKPYLNSRQLSNIVIIDNKFSIQSNFVKTERFIPIEIEITPTLMKLFGLYLAEGSLNNNKKDGITFSFNSSEFELIDFVLKEVKKVFGLEVHDVTSKNREDVKNIKFYSSVLHWLFYLLFGSGARNKKIHSVLINQSDELIKELLYGEFLGDGHYGKTDYEFSFSTTSINVAYALRLIMARLGIISSVRTSRVEYKVNVSGISKRILLDMFGIEYDTNRSWKNGRDKAFQNDDYLLLPIKKIKKSSYKGKLIDIQVANTNDFVAENVIVHNSWLESMATKTPVIMPDNTMLGEFITEDRGWLVKSGTNPSLFTILPHDNEIIRPLVDVDDLTKIMLEVYNNPEEVKKRVENAYLWATTALDWKGQITKDWVNIFDTAYEDLMSSKNEMKSVVESDKALKTEVF